MTSGSPFDGWFKKHLPAFFFEKFTGSDLARIEALFGNLEITFDNLYQKVKSFPDQLDMYEAEAKYLYHLAGVIGINGVDITDLSTYFDTDGNVDTDKISQAGFDIELRRQRMYVATAMSRWLLKGTKESIVRLLYAQGYSAAVKELWTEDIVDGPFFEYNNALVTKYGDPIYVSGGDLYNESTFDLASEIEGDVVTASVSAVEYWEQNNYGYQYVIDKENNDLYYKTNTNPTSGSAETWYAYDVATLPVSGNVTEIKILSDMIYIRTDLNNLIVYDYDLDSAILPERFKIDDYNCYFMEFIENGTRLFLDRGGWVEVRDTDAYQKIASPAIKPTGNLETVEQIVKKKNAEYLIFNSNDKAYIFSILTDLYEMHDPSTVYDMNISGNEATHKLFRIQDNEFAIIKYNTSDNKLKSSFIYFDENYEMGLATSPLASAGAFADVNDIYGYSDQVLILGSDTIAIYNLTERELDIYYEYVTGGYEYQKVFFLDKFYFRRTNPPAGDIDFIKILGWNSYLDALYKSHYFDVEIGITEDSPSLADIAASVNLLIPLAKPVHTELQNVTSTLLELAASMTETTSANDNTTLIPTSAGGSEFIIGITGKYDGEHPWKRGTGEPFKYQCDGIDGRPLLKYREVSFPFGVTVTNDQLDTFIHTNTPFPSGG